MAHIEVRSSAGRRATNAEVSLVPFIDLLLCCVMFLLVTAVWTQLASVDVIQNGNGPEDAPPPSAVPEPALVRVHAGGYEVSDPAGLRTEIPRLDGDYDLLRLSEVLGRIRDLGVAELTVVPDDGVAFDQVVRTVDRARGAGFRDVALTGAGG
jgi:biopolymer transport protein ExbD